MRKIAAGLLLSTAVIVVFLAAMEVVLRQSEPESSGAGFQEQLLTHEHGVEGIGMLMRPNAEAVYEGFIVKLPPTVIRSNADGLRDWPYSVERAPA